MKSNKSQSGSVSRSHSGGGRGDSGSAAPSLPPFPDWDEYAIRFIEGESDPDFLAIIGQLLAEPSFRSILCGQAYNTAALQTCLQGRTAESQDGAQQGSPLSAASIPRGAESSTFSGNAPSVASRVNHFLGGGGATAIAATIAIAVCGALLLDGWNKPSTGLNGNVVLVSLDEPEGEVYIRGAPVGSRAYLHPGDMVQTEGPLSSVNLQFDDGTALQLGGDSAASVEEQGGKHRVILDYGHVVKSVRSTDQHSHPVSILTPTAVLEGSDGVFAVSATHEQTSLSVEQGAVLMRNTAGSGEASLCKLGVHHASKDELPRPAIIPESAPSVWAVDSDDGLPTGWRQGDWVSDSSLGCVSASRRALNRLHPEQPVDVARDYQIRSQADWVSGLARVSRDAVLRYRVKMRDPGWYGVFIGIRSGEIRDGRWAWNYQFQETDLALASAKSDEWRTVEAPLSKFRRTNPKSLPRPSRGEVVPTPSDGLLLFAIFTTHEHDRDSMIDNIQFLTHP